MRSFSRVAVELPSQWRALVRNVFARFEIVKEYVHYSMLFDLDPNFAGRLTNWSDPNLESELGKLTEAVVPDLRGERIGTIPGYSQKCPVIAYLEPSRDFYSKPDGSDKERDEIADELLAYLNQREIMVEPRLLVDAVFFHSSWAIAPRMGLIAAPLLAPIRGGSEREIFLPKIVEDVMQLMLIIQQLKHLGDRLERLPLYDVKVKRYLDGLQSGVRVLNSYRTRFLGERQQTETECQQISVLADSLEASFTSNEAKTHEGDLLSLPLSAFKKSSAIFVINDAITQALKEVEPRLIWLRQRLAETRRTVDMLVDYLRDLTLSETAESNLSLQRSICILSIFALIIALLGFLQSFVPEEIKCRILHLIGQLPCLRRCLSDQAAITFSRTIALPASSVAYGVLPSQRFPWFPLRLLYSSSHSSRSR
jgi:hypothetical protein